jgi:tRNA(fMet)-specific endonuclease VapC
LDMRVLQLCANPYLFKSDSRAEGYRPHLTGRLLVVSFMTVAELDRWALQRDWGEARRARMEQHLRNFVVYPFNRSLCLRWAEVADRARRKGRPIGVADAWIAATALEHDIPLITNNAGHYAGVEGLTVVAETTRQE